MKVKRVIKMTVIGNMVIYPSTGHTYAVGNVCPHKGTGRGI